VTLRKLVPSDTEAERLADLLADARAIPAAMFIRSKCASRTVIDLTIVPVQRTAMRIPAATVSLVEAAEHQLAGYRR
jgi:hypothetical protein